MRIHHPTLDRTVDLPRSAAESLCRRKGWQPVDEVPADQPDDVDTDPNPDLDDEDGSVPDEGADQED